MTLDEIKQEADKVNQNDIETIKFFIRNKAIFNENLTILMNALESRNSSFVCLHIIRNGYYPNGMQKYEYYNCHCTFNGYKDILLECSKINRITWIEYLIIMNQDKNLRNCAQYAGVFLKTSFYMHHRILSAYRNSIENIQLSRITEIDETEMLISFSGNYKIHNPKSYLPRKL